MNQRSTLFNLIVRQQPSKARLCSFKEKVDRRPIDPPPIIQLTSSRNIADNQYLHNPNFFLYATLTDASGETDLNFVNGNRTTAGTVVQSLHKLKDHDNTEGGFFIFSDISVRLEGFYRLKFTLYEIEGLYVNRLSAVISDIFQVYSPKSFPGMSESTFLTRSFSDQGVRIRIRKEPRISSSNTITNTTSKRRRKRDEEEKVKDLINSESSQTNNYIDCSNSPQSRLIHNYPTSSTDRRSLSPQPYHIRRPTLPSPKEIFRSSPMSMENLLSNDKKQVPLPTTTTAIADAATATATSSSSVLFPSISVVDNSNSNNENRLLFNTRILPLPIPSQSQLNKEASPVKKQQLNSSPSTTTTTTTTTSNSSVSSSSWL
ncbi:MAG: velvet factor-domain-containing protein [Benjaminiella poitrasii]|nr:MAG: velvet factor-domain-containing protein [Benjaminiella poitrasii]